MWLINHGEVAQYLQLQSREGATEARPETRVCLDDAQVIKLQNAGADISSVNNS